MINVNITSDSHLYHKNIIKYCNRPFYDLTHMHQTIISEWNAVVAPDEVVIHLGDYTCGGNFEQVKEITDQLNGRKILVLGNHDGRSINWFKRCGFDKVVKRLMRAGEYCFSHIPMVPEFLEDNNLKHNYHGHTHKYQYGGPYRNFGVDVVGYKPLKVDLNVTEQELWDAPSGFTGLMVKEEYRYRFDPTKYNLQGEVF